MGVRLVKKVGRHRRHAQSNLEKKAKTGSTSWQTIAGIEAFFCAARHPARRSTPVFCLFGRVAMVCLSIRRNRTSGPPASLGTRHSAGIAPIFEKLVIVGSFPVAGSLCPCPE